MIRIEPRLQQALDEPSSPGEMLEVVLRFALPSVAHASSVQDKRAQIAEAVARDIDNALSGAGQATGDVPELVSKFPGMGSALVRAPKPYVEALLDQPGVTGATLNASPARGPGRI